MSRKKVIRISTETISRKDAATWLDMNHPEWGEIPEPGDSVSIVVTRHVRRHFGLPVGRGLWSRLAAQRALHKRSRLPELRSWH